MKARAIWHTNENKTEILEESIFSELEEETLVKAKYSFISSGTEALVRNGLVPKALQEPMKVNYMGGSFTFPVKYGYSMVGETRDGRHIHLMHPHQDYFFAKESDIYLLPQAIPLKRATLLSNLETTLNAIWDAQLCGDERILIIGFGGIGALLALTMEHYLGVKPDISELDEQKMKIAYDAGLKNAAGDYDIIFHTSASYTGLQYAINHTRKEGKIIELSWYGIKSTKLDLGGNFHYGRLKIISSQVSTVSPFAPIVGYKERKDIACALLNQDAFDSLITHEIPFEEAPRFYDHLIMGQYKSELATVIKYT